MTGVLPKALHKNLFLSDFTSANLANPTIHAMSERLDFDIDSTMPLNSAISIIRTRDGKEFETRVDILRGNVLNPMSMQEIREKFKSNAAHAKCPLSPGAIEGLAEAILNLDRMDSTQELFAYLDNTCSSS